MGMENLAWLDSEKKHMSLLRIIIRIEIHAPSPSAPLIVLNPSLTHP